MSWLPYLFCSMYTASYPLSWYRAKYQFQPGWTRPSILNRDNIVFYWSGSVAVTLAAMAGLWWCYGLIGAAVAIAVRFAFGIITMRVYYNRALSVEIARYLGILERECSLDNPETIAQVVVLARHAIMSSTRGDDYSTPNSSPLEEMRLREKDFAYVPTLNEIRLAVSLRDGLQFEDVPPEEDSLRREQYIARFWDRLTSTIHEES